MAENGRDSSDQIKNTAEKEVRLRNVKDRQNEERQKKLEEIKAQAMAAQRFKEQKEMERRRRLDDLKGKEDGRRQQVEERKRAIVAAEQDRLVSILKRNQEREVRIEAKKRNERSNIVFAFGSSTPRMLDPTDMTSSFWGQRRATSIQNITCSTSTSLTRRQSERDLDGGSKKRATSAGGLERSGESSSPMTPAGCVSGYVGRRRTDLMPTIPSRDSSFSTSRKSLNHSPGRAYSMTRLDQLAQPRKRADLPVLSESASDSFRSLSAPRQSSVTRSMSHLAVGKTGPLQPKRPLNKSDSRSMHQLSVDGAAVAPRTTRATQLRQQKLLASSNGSEASSRPSSSLSQQSTTSVTSSVSVRHRPSSAPRRPRPASIAITGVTIDARSDKKGGEMKPPLPKARKPIANRDNSRPVKNKAASPGDGTPKSLTSPVSATNSIITTTTVEHKTAEISGNTPQTIPVPQQQAITETPQVEEVKITTVTAPAEPQETTLVPTDNLLDIAAEPTPTVAPPTSVTVPPSAPVAAAPIEPEVVTTVAEAVPPAVAECLKTEIVVSAPAPLIPVESPVLSPENIKHITSELIRRESDGTVPPAAPAPAAAAAELKPVEVTEMAGSMTSSMMESKDEMSASVTKVRINTEEQAKAALAERRRLIREEAERQAELERLRIEQEAQAELERQRREEEQVQMLVEQQRIAEQERLEEAIKETQRREEEERLRREEEQRSKLQKEEADRKAREEAEKKAAEQAERLKNEEKEREARRKRVEAIMRRTRGMNNANAPSQNSEDKNENKAENKLNGTKQVEQENGSTKNGKDVDLVDNIIPDETMKNANNVSIDTINSTDSINSNNTWQATQQFGNFVNNNSTNSLGSN